ncbi:hypothetical protein BRW62_04180 [Parathermosynechococcus lividus PCC 6715]|uniref:UPF0182 protein BRW62_04180 n=1 Tax=Parathermosynechococcus lividus PCC 6715 TaxID=1917166 RepID=A0A2D2Q0U0_PARLV|nr:UPF0182 family protein [Thermostichus lividus]ATS18079.1 hypothetical protein BRW62_04180 [Thermostichus lividus PCC 6715]
MRYRSLGHSLLYWLGWLVAAIALGIVICRLLAESLWFHHLGYAGVLWLRWGVQGLLLIFVVGLSGLFYRWHQRRAYQQCTVTLDAELTAHSRYRGLGLLGLLSAAAGLIGLLIVATYHIGAIAVQLWQQRSDMTINTPLLPQLSVWRAADLLQQILQNPWLLLVSAGTLILGLWAPLHLFRGISVILSLAMGAIALMSWSAVLTGVFGVSDPHTEPLFHRSISFYLFRLPLLELLRLWLVNLSVVSLAGVALTYLLANDSLSHGKFLGFVRSQRRHLQGLSAFVFATVAFSFWLERYKLLYSTNGAAFGAGYTDVTVRLPLYGWLCVSALAVAMLLGWSAIRQGGRGQRRLGPIAPGLFSFTLGYLVVILVADWLLPNAIEAAIVEPNQLERELPYIQRTITHTREGFNLDTMRVEPFQPENNLNAEIIAANEATTRNIRVWDTRPLLETNRQLQQLRSYYRFPAAFLDRYSLKLANQQATPELRQVLIAAREIDYSAVQQFARSWINEHLVFTHGYGFTMSPVNTAEANGLPKYFVRDIGENGELLTFPPQLRENFPFFYPRLYYGELTNTYIFAPSHVPELDFPRGSDNVYNHYDGSGGVAISAWWRRLIYAVYFRDWQVLLTPNLRPDSRVLFRRTIQERVQAIAPFLRIDSEPYLVIADPRSESDIKASHRSAGVSYLYWIIDAYTLSRHYPYADPGKHSFNYIRNSVKIVVDAYNGDVTFYVVEPEDVILRTWQRIFPQLFRPISAMPHRLYTHIRYPVDMLQIQSEQLLQYHMTDPVVFYNREDLWQIPQEIYRETPQSVAPYYLITKLPIGYTEEFVLLVPFTPVNRPNLIGWLAARSDGQNYGKLLLYVFPKQELVFGPEQMEARINQDPLISQQISLWNRQGSRSVQGNLLIIPIERSLLYVEPIYLEASQNSLPTLARVIVMDNERLVMAPTLEEGLKQLFPAAS